MLMLIKKTPSKENNKDKMTLFMIDMTNQFQVELNNSNNVKETIDKLHEFILVLKTVLSEDNPN